MPCGCFSSTGLNERNIAIYSHCYNPRLTYIIIYVAAHPIQDEAISLYDMKSIFVSLRNQGFVGKFIGELLTKVSHNKGGRWVTDKWDQAGLKLSNLINPELEDAEKITTEYVSIPCGDRHNYI